MIDPISLYLDAGLVISFILAAIQDFRSNEVYDLTWLPAGVGIVMFLWLTQALFVFILEAVSVGFILGTAYYLYHKELLDRGDVIALTVLAFAPLAAVFTILSAAIVSRIHRGPIPFVGFLGLAFLVVMGVFAALPFRFV